MIETADQLRAALLTAEGGTLQISAALARELGPFELNGRLFPCSIESTWVEMSALGFYSKLATRRLEDPSWEGYSSDVVEPWLAALWELRDQLPARAWTSRPGILDLVATGFDDLVCWVRFTEAEESGAPKLVDGQLVQTWAPSPLPAPPRLRELTMI